MEKVLFSAADIRRMLARLAHEIVEKNTDISTVALVGVLRRGVPLAKSIAVEIEAITGTEVPVGMLDITLYRDDLREIGDSARLRGSAIDFSIVGKKIIIVDDVIFTGRTVRAAIDAIFDINRPKCIQLLTLVDRGHRELPIKPDFVGKNIPTSLSEKIMVEVPEYDGESAIKLCSLK